MQKGRHFNFADSFLLPSYGQLAKGVNRIPQVRWHILVQNKTEGVKVADSRNFSARSAFYYLRAAF